MARIRTIKPEFFTSEQIVECSTNARLQFLGVLCFSDDGGRHPASAKRLKMEVWPGDPCTIKDVEKWQTELIHAGLIVEYTDAQGLMLWCVTGWQRHQRVDKPTIKFRGPFDDGSTIVRGALATESNGVESNGVESNVGEVSPTTPLVRAPKIRKPREAFQKPTLDDVRAYCRERDNAVGAEIWYAHYEANGWKVGRNQMKDWKASVRTWEHNHPKPAEAESRIITEEDIAKYGYHGATGCLGPDGTWMEIVRK